MKNNFKSRALLLTLMVISGMVAFAQHDTIPNGGMEQWTSNSGGWSDPTDWMSDNIYTDVAIVGKVVCFKETAAAHVHSGLASAKLETQSIFGNIGPGTITTGYINSSTQAITGGCAINYRPLKFRGWFQYAPSGVDTFVANISLFTSTDTVNPIGTAGFTTTSTVSAWTKFDLPITYTSSATPAIMQIIIASGTGNNSQAGTIAYVDDLSLVDCSLLSVSATPTAATCTQNNGSVVAAGIGGTGPYTYAWSNASTATTISGVAPATYNVVATDAEGCSASATAAVTTSNVPFTLSLTPTAATCTTATGSVAAAASAGVSPYTYAWSNSTTAATLSAVHAGTYSVTVTDSHGCSTTSSSTVNSNNVAFTVTPTNGTTSCGSNTGTVSVAASAGTFPYTYLWANASTGSNLTGLGAGSYDVTVTDAHGCTTSAAAAVATPGGPTATDTVTNLSCYNNNSGKIAVTVSGGATPINYLWSNAATTVSLTGIAAATYTLTITDHNNCSFEVSATLSQPTAIFDSVSTTEVTCYGLSNGAAMVTASGGTQPYTYAWLSGPSTQPITGVAAGTYKAVITDGNGCVDTATAVINQPGALLLTGTAVNVSCNGGSNGVLSVSTVGGTMPYSYAWSNSGTDTSITGLSAGNYTAIVIDAHQCTDTLALSVTQPTALAVTLHPTSASSSTATDGSDIALGSGGTTPLNYAWSNSATGSNLTGLAPGQYCVTITDGNHCTVSGCDSVSYTTGINTISTALIRIYPNPASNQLTIETNSAEGKFLFTVYSLDGKLVEQQTIAGEKSTIILNQLTNGLYTYQLKEITSGNVNYGKLEIIR